VALVRLAEILRRVTMRRARILHPRESGFTSDLSESEIEVERCAVIPDGATPILHSNHVAVVPVSAA
jgi:hypothetical protein